MVNAIDELKKKLESQFLSNVNYDEVCKTSAQIDKLINEYYHQNKPVKS